MDDGLVVFFGIGELCGASSFAEAIFEWTNFRLDVMDYTYVHFVSFLIKPTGSFANCIARTEVIEAFIILEKLLQ